MTELSGVTDPDRILPLLWRNAPGTGRPTAGPAPTVGRKPRLTVDAVVDGAVALADEHGIGQLSMARLAERLGVAPMTLYSYAPSKAELVDLMVDQALAEGRWPGPVDSQPPAWRERARDYVERVHAVYRAHPWLAHVSTVRPPIGPAMLAEHEYALSCFADTGLPARDQASCAEAVTVWAHAQARRTAEEATAQQATGQAADQWWGERMRLWEEYFDPGRHPATNATWHAGGFDVDPDATLGLRLLLDGIGAHIAAQGGPPRRDHAPGTATA